MEQRSRIFWYEFFSDLGFIIVPYAYLYHSTTAWKYDHVAIGDNIALPDSQAYHITKSNKEFFFYHLDEQMQAGVIDVMLQLAPLIDQGLAKYSISFDLLPYWGSNLSAFAEHPRLKGFSSQMFFSIIAQIIDEFDPFDWQKQGGTSNAWSDLNAYGFLLLDIQKIPTT